MGIWRRLSGKLFGGTYVSIDGEGDASDPYKNGINADVVQRLSAVWACMNIRAETGGHLPFALRGKDKRIVTDHPLDFVLRRKANALQTSGDLLSQVIAQMDMHGNHVSIIDRGTGGKIVALMPQDPDQCSFEVNKSGTRRVWTINGDTYQDRDVLHIPGFALKGGWGTARLDIGRSIFGGQLEANSSATASFRNGMKLGGMFKVEKNLSAEQLKDFVSRMNTFSRPENAGRWLTLMAGMSPVAGEQFRIKPADAQLLESRYFGIEEICRLFSTPPPLIGHTSKSSSWASSIENLNLFFLQYSLQPTLVRIEKHMEVKLLSPAELASGLQLKFAMQGLLRGDSKSRNAGYVNGLQNGYLSQNDVLDMEDRPGIGPEGDIYRVQLNMANADSDDEKPTNRNNEDTE